MAQTFKAGIFRLLDENDVYQPILAIKGEKGDTGASPATEAIRTIVSTEIAKVVAEAPEDFDTLKEIADWIDSHEDDASAMNTSINTLKGQVGSFKFVSTTESEYTALTTKDANTIYFVRGD